MAFLHCFRGRRFMIFAPQNRKLKLLEVYADAECDWPHPTKRTGRDEVFATAGILFPFEMSCGHCDLDLRLGHPFCLKVVSLEGLQRTGHRSFAKAETGPCSVSLEVLCSEAFKTRWCKTRGTSPSLDVEGVALRKLLLSR